MVEKVLEVHQSSLKTWRRCHKAYDYKYIQRLQKRRTPNALIRGTIVHAMIEAKAKGDDPWEVFDKYIEENHKVFMEEEEYFGIEEMISDIMEGYFAYYKNDDVKPYPIKKDGETKWAEHAFSVPLVPEEGIYFGGVIDMIVQDAKKRIWLMDHKTHKTLPKGDIAYLNPQSNLYSWAMSQLDYLPTPDGMIWNYIRWKQPSKPQVLKDGSLSKSTRIDTTWGIYKKAVREAGLDIKDYTDMEEALKGKEEDFYVRHYLPINQNIQKNLVEDAKCTAIEILHNAGKVKDRNITRDCSWCEFYPLCQAELKGLDTSTMLKFDYKEKEDDAEKESDEEQI